MSLLGSIGLAYMIKMGPPRAYEQNGVTITPGITIGGEVPLVLYADRQWAFVPAVFLLIAGFALQVLPEIVGPTDRPGRTE